jgi:hypothetical protein
MIRLIIKLIGYQCSSRASEVLPTPGVAASSQTRPQVGQAEASPTTTATPMVNNDQENDTQSDGQPGLDRGPQERIIQPLAESRGH